MQQPNLSLRRDSYADDTLFPNAKSRIETLGVEDLLQEFATSNKYHTAMDYLFCALYPAYEKSCRRFYQVGGSALDEILNPMQISFIDKILAGAVETLSKKRAEMLAQKDQKEEEKI